MFTALAAIAALISTPCCPAERLPPGTLILASITTTGAGKSAGGGGGGGFTPSLDFSDARNSQYLAVLF